MNALYWHQHNNQRRQSSNSTISSGVCSSEMMCQISGSIIEIKEDKNNLKT
jgi:hypothetical protein